ncbi:MAG TPA: response regulator [Pseudolabrys sp.]|jgi:CheY-like chemotaxis protein|nr:response regulator [Pseudolabrys sp.]
MGEAVPQPTVLLVEDETLISHLVADVLAERGFAVYEVASAEEALDYIGRGGPVDVLFTDVNLPGIDGAELADRVRALHPDLPILYASGRYHAADIASMVSRSIFVSKPYDPTDVCSLLRRLTGD